MNYGLWVRGHRGQGVDLLLEIRLERGPRSLWRHHLSMFLWSLGVGIQGFGFKLPNSGE